MPQVPQDILKKDTGRKRTEVETAMIDRRLWRAIVSSRTPLAL